MNNRELDAKMAELMDGCLDCSLPYEEFGLDMTLPDNQWLMIHPEENGLLCANCIVKRAEKLQGSIAVRAKIALAEELDDE